MDALDKYMDRIVRKGHGSGKAKGMLEEETVYPPNKRL